MTRSRALVALCLWTASACQDDAGEADEVGDSSESTTEVSTFEDSGESDASSSDSSGSDASTESGPDSSGSDSSTESGSDASTESGSDSSGSDASTESGSDSSSESGSDSSSSSGESTTGEDAAPFVIEVSPLDATIGVGAATNLTVTFSEAMDGTTLTTNTADTSCSGTVQVSATNFASCVRMSAQPSSGDDLTFTLDPLAPLASVTTYELRVLADVTDALGTPMAGDFTSGGFTVRYFHTIVLDGINDFTADETFTSSTLGHVGYVAWDETHLYLGMNSPDLAGNAGTIFWVAYLGGLAGNNVGVMYNTQQPLLPFAARYHLRYKASDDFGGGMQWNGNAWVAAGFGPVVGSNDVAVSAGFLELRVAWSNLGDPDALELHLGMLREQAFNEASWAAIPSNSYVDGYDPNYTHYYEFDVLGSTLPNDHAPL